jgi:proteasome assembly chaperone 4
MDPVITTHHTFLPSSTPSLPSFHLHLTRLTSTLFIWVGTGRPSGLIAGGTEGSGAGSEVLEQAEAAGGDVKRLTADWAVAMPSRGVSAATSHHEIVASLGGNAVSSSR